MKKMLALMLSALFILGGCSSGDEAVEEERFSLSKEKQKEYTAVIDEVLHDFYWEYDAETLEYCEAQVPDDKTGVIYAASRDSGYSLGSHKGRKAVVYTADLYHFNNSKAGIVYFYFINDDLSGVYYTPDDSNGRSYSLLSRNVFRNNAVFTKFEDTKADNAQYDQYGISAKIYDGFADIKKESNGQTYFLNIEGNNIRKYTLSNNQFIIVNGENISTATDGLTPVSAVMLENGETAVIVGSEIEDSADFEGNAVVLSEKIIFLDQRLNITDKEIPLDAGTYTCIGRYNDGFVTINDRSIDVYKAEGEGFKKSEMYPFEVQCYDFKQSDIDGDGAMEYFATDGKDLLMFRKEKSGFECAWRTNISIASFYGNICTGDLNGDGIKEVYICDSTGTAIKYILTENGLVSDNNEIDYGNRIFAGDYNGDGKDDFVFIESAEGGSITLNLGK
ncbi:MAG: VCBS repeat-containing protein [Firmicutes bacterium]|nr:VCBS repeat-containing protein [Bacillota bacterium]